MKNCKLTTQIHLESISLFEGLSLKELAKVKKKIKLISYDKGEILFTEADPCVKILIVQEGRMKLFRHSPDGKEQIIEVLEAGDSCACNPGSPQWACSTSAQALVNMKVIVIPRSVYSSLLESNHQLAKRLNQILAKRLCRFCSLIESVSLDDPAQRVAKFLLDASSGHCNAQGIREVTVTLTHEEIAQRLGLARETVSRHLSRLTKQKIIKTQARKIQILSAPLLESPSAAFLK